MGRRTGSQDFLNLILDGLAVYRLTVLVTEDKIGEPIRKSIVRAGKSLGQEEPAKYLSKCPWCVSAYLGTAASVVRSHRTWRSVRYPLALSAISGILSEI